MRNLFLLLTAVLLLGSCSQNTDDENTLISKNETYKVAFSVKGFSVSANPIASSKTKASLPAGNYCQYVIYNEDGSVFTNKRIESEDIISSQTISIEEELPAGIYHIAVLSAKKLASPNPILTPSNYNTDVCHGNNYIAGDWDNNNIYYETITFTINGESNQPIDILLEPMWSNLNIAIKDADICALPSGTTHLFCQVDPFYSGFSIKTKEPVSSSNGEFHETNLSKLVSIEKFKEDKGILGKTQIAASKNVSVAVVFIKNSPELQKYVVLGKKTVYNGDFERGLNITLSGNLGNANNSNNQLFNISGKSLVDVTIPFTE